jgi:protein gp37
MMQWVNYHVTLHKTATAPRNVWLGVSCEDQKRADERIPLLLQTPAAVHFISCEPLLGLIDLKFPKEPNPNPGDTWVIVGGESGPGARPCRIGWIRDIIRQCGEVNVPVFVKQLGAHPFWMDGEGRHELKLNDRKGGDMREWPDSDLKVRQYPMEAK